MTTDRRGRAGSIAEKIQQKFRDEEQLFERMAADFDLWTLEPFEPDQEDSISPDDSYTSNAPRVLAEKIIAFITATELVIRVPNDEAQEPQEARNASAESLAIGFLRHADQRLQRKGMQVVKEALAWYSTVRGRYAAMRSILRKDATGQTFIDMLPLDPALLVIEWGDTEPVWAAYRSTATRAELRSRYPRRRLFEDGGNSDDDEIEEVFEYFEGTPVAPNRMNPASQNPFERRPITYTAGTVVDSRFVRPMHDIFTLHFPVVAVPIDSQPSLTPPWGEKRGEDTFPHYGESVFAENRRIWPVLNRATSYAIDLMAKGSDPRQKVYSADGTMTLEEGSRERGAEVNLSTANQEEIQPMLEADISRASAFVQSIVQHDSISGGLPDQAFGILDKPLSSVALRQLGNNLEHRVMPRMRAVASCVELSLGNLLEQYGTGGFAPIVVSGRSISGARFAGKIIQPQEMVAHDPLEVSMQLALPEDLATIWSVAQMATTPTASGEPLASLEWAREHILRLPSHRIIRNQNLEILARSQDPLAQILELFNMATAEGDEALASILYDRLRIMALQRQVEGSVMMQQLQQMAAGGPVPPPAGPAQPGAQPGGPPAAAPNQQANPANGAVPFAQTAGVGNQPSPEAGANTTAPRGGGPTTEQRLNAIGLETA